MPNKTKRMLPPAYFFLAIIVMALLHFMLPVESWVVWPWNFGGIALISLGSILNIIADRQFKRHQTTVRPFQPSSVLVTDGVFGWSRNPMYLGMVLILAGIGIGLGTLPSFIVIPIFTWWMRAKFISAEEQDLAKQFGQAYEAYKTRVRRWM